MPYEMESPLLSNTIIILLIAGISTNLMQKFSCIWSDTSRGSE